MSEASTTMVHTGAVTASAATATASQSQPQSQSTLPRPSVKRYRHSGSFHAGEPFPDLSPYCETPLSASRRQRQRSSAAGRPAPVQRKSTARYHTFPTEPPATPLNQHQQTRPRKGSWLQSLLRHSRSRNGDDDNAYFEPTTDERGSSATPSRRAEQPDSSHHHMSPSTSPASTPLPWKQLALLALLSLAEQTALNSIGPYLPAMVASFPKIPSGQEGLYVGLLASAFAMAQLTTNLLWGWLSDRVGRKPVMLIGTSLLAGCFCFFGVCTTYAHLIMVHVAMGLLNGNAAVVPTCLGEVTDKTNQSRAFTWLPVIYSLGSITGPALGGLLVETDTGMDGGKYPYLTPNLVVAGFLAISVIVLGIWFEETLEGGHNGASGGSPGGWLGWLRNMVQCIRRQQKSGKHRSESISSDRHQQSEEQQALLGTAGPKAANEDDEEDGISLTPSQKKSAFRQLANRNTMAVLGTYLVFQLANISFNSLYPIFVSAPPPTGRELGPGTIGLALSLAGLATIVFQVLLFEKLKTKIGNLGTYRYSLLGMAVAMSLMPWIGYLDSKSHLGIGSGKAWLYSELGVILIIKNICAVGGLSSVMLLITNSAPSHETLGTLNGIAQTLSAAGRSVGPFLSGGLFTLSMRVRPKGEALAWGTFAGVTLGGWIWSWVIKGQGLESAEYEGDEDEHGDAEDEDDDADVDEERVAGR
ncbi:major facilitator superfamily domain-containing protein [Triangularia setosa]|uniref:Major facilitator superfamily domain-containing protein n=1 Tax=Triangularia setosa TaxID=2587417 RepID=A0AAN6WEA5_9PEZI|nr:major facilitator superfamily domain-containing protein [Podospora setosa]